MSFFDYVCWPFAQIVSLVNSWTGSYLLALLAFTIVLKVVLFPLSIKQQKNSQRQAKMRPKEEAIRLKYAGRTDKPTQQKLQQEIMEMYQKEKFSPLSGCMPLLIQLPLLIILYSIVRQPLIFTAGYNADQVNALGKSVVIVERYQELSESPDALGGDFSVRRDASGRLIFKNPQTGAEEVVVDYFASNGHQTLDFIPLSANGGEGEKTSVDYTAQQINEAAFVTPIHEHRSEVEAAYNALVGESVKEEKFGDAASLNLEKRVPNFRLFNGAIDLGKTPSLSPIDLLILIPILTFITSFFGQMLTRKFTYQPQGQESQSSMKLMNIAMPLFSVYITFVVPAGVAVYWIMQNCIGPFQQILLAKLYPIPKMSEEELKAARDEYLAKQKGKKEKAVLSAPKRRSLVYDDDEDLPEIEEESEVTAEQPQTLLNGSPIGKEQLKESAPSKHKSKKK